MTCFTFPNGDGLQRRLDSVFIFSFLCAMNKVVDLLSCRLVMHVGVVLYVYYMKISLAMFLRVSLDNTSFYMKVIVRVLHVSNPSLSIHDRQRCERWTRQDSRYDRLDKSSNGIRYLANSLFVGWIKAKFHLRLSIITNDIDRQLAMHLLLDELRRSLFCIDLR